MKQEIKLLLQSSERKVKGVNHIATMLNLWRLIFFPSSFVVAEEDSKKYISMKRIN